jgi:putative oxidoreductase
MRTSRDRDRPHWKKRTITIEETMQEKPGIFGRFLSWKGHSWISLPLRLYIGYVFLYACYHKIVSPGSFAVDVATYQILPLQLINLMAIILPWIELAAGIMIVIGWRTRAASLLIAGMMAIFIVAIAIALAKGLDMSCGCFASQSIEEDPISMMTIVRDLGWFVIPVYAMIFDNNPIGVDRIANNLKRRKVHA